MINEIGNFNLSKAQSSCFGLRQSGEASGHCVVDSDVNCGNLLDWSMESHDGIVEEEPDPVQKVPQESGDTNKRYSVGKALEVSDPGPTSEEGMYLTWVLNRRDLARAVELHMEIRRLTEELSKQCSAPATLRRDSTLKKASTELTLAQNSLKSMNLSKAALEIAERLSQNPDLKIFAYNRMIQDKFGLTTSSANIRPASDYLLKLMRSDALKKELFAFAEATDTWAPGEYMYQDSKATGEALRGLKITIGFGLAVPKRVVEDVLQTIERDGQRPGSLRIEAYMREFVGHLDPLESYEILVKGVDGASMIYLHEAGHLHNLRHLSRQQEESALLD